MSLLTVYVPTRNRALLLKRCLSTVQMQSFENWQCIIVDDASTDNTSEVAKNFCDDVRFKYRRLEAQSGACVARNTAIFEAQTKFIIGIDDDDILLPNRFSDLLAAIGDKTAVGSQDFILNSRKCILTRRPNEIDRAMITRRNCVGNQLLIRTHALQDIGGFDTRLSAFQDYDLWVRLIDRYGGLQIIDRPGQIISDLNQYDRITNNAIRRIEAYDYFIEKHRGIFDNRSLAYHLNELLILRQSRPSIFNACRAFDWTTSGFRDFMRTLYKFVQYFYRRSIRKK